MFATGYSIILIICEYTPFDKKQETRTIGLMRIRDNELVHGTIAPVERERRTHRGHPSPLAPHAILHFSYILLLHRLIQGLRPGLLLANLQALRDPDPDPIDARHHRHLVHPPNLPRRLPLHPHPGILGPLNHGQEMRHQRHAVLLRNLLDSLLDGCHHCRAACH